MPEQPNNKAEEMLQRHARERRERGGDFSLHPATRRLLQGEVTRQFGASAPEKRSAFTWFTAWRAAGFSAALVVLLGVGVWVFSRDNGALKNSATQLAKVDEPKSIVDEALREKREQPVALRKMVEDRSGGDA